MGAIMTKNGAAFLLAAMTMLAASQALARPDNAVEIRRGFSANNGCAIQAQADSKLLAQCYRDAAAKAEAAHADSRAFEVGLYFGGCLHFDSMIVADTSLAPSNKLAADDLPGAKAQFDHFFRALQARQKELGLTYEDIVSGTPILPNLRPAYIAQLGRWAAAQ